MDAVRLIRRELSGRVPLIGFAGSPWTIATYMIEGGGSKDLTRARAMLYAAPALAHALLDVLARAIAAYLNAQIAAGAQAVMIFDTWGGVLAGAAYREYSLRYMEEIVSGLTRTAEGRRVPCILFTKGGAQWLDAMAASGCDALGVDWTIDIGAARLRVGDRVALQGNLDPCALHAPPEELRAQVAAVLASYGRGSGHVFNLGHGIHPDVDPEQVSVLVEAVHELSAPYH
jgi:uroporphyrinogen decarboxylase